MKKKEIVFICLYGNFFGGMERRYTRLAEHLSKSRNYNVTLITFTDAVSVLQHLGIDMKFLTIKIVDSSRLLRLINSIKLVRKYHGSMLRIRIMLYLKFKSPSRIVFCHNPDTLYDIFMLYKGAIKNNLFSNIAPVSVAAVDSHLSNYSESSINVLHKLFSIDSLSPRIGKFLQSHNMEANVKIAPCSFTDYSKVQLSKRKDIDILMVARFTEKKGYALLEDIAEIAENYKLVVCGFGDLSPQLPNAEITSLTNPLPLYSRAKIFLSIQETNNYPSQSLLEAMASGCAVIATDVGETRLILDESNSILINYDSGELKNAIEQLMRNPELTAELGSNARKKVLEEHTIEKYADYFCNEVLALEMKSE